MVGGASGSFDLTPSVASISDGLGGSSTMQDVEFDGAAGRRERTPQWVA